MYLNELFHTGLLLSGLCKAARLHIKLSLSMDLVVFSLSTLTSFSMLFLLPSEQSVLPLQTLFVN